MIVPLPPLRRRWLRLLKTALMLTAPVLSLMVPLIALIFPVCSYLSPLLMMSSTSGICLMALFSEPYCCTMSSIWFSAIEKYAYTRLSSDTVTSGCAMLLFTSAPTRYGIMDATPFTGERTSVYERLLLAFTSSALHRASFASASTRSFCAVMRSNSDTTSCSYRSLLLSRMSSAVERAASALLTFATAISYAALYGVWSMTKST